MEKYRAVRVVDCCNDTLIYLVIMLNNKHTVEDLQKEIYRIKNEYAEELMEYGNDVEFVLEHISDEFDWFEPDFDTQDYVEI